MRRAARSNGEQLPDRLDRALASADLHGSRKAWWWPIFTVLQWVALLSLVVGLGWLAAIFAAGYFQFQLPPTPQVEGFPVPTLLVALGIALGILLAMLAGVIALAASKIKASRARRKLREQVAQVAEKDIVAPVQAELQHYAAFRAALARALAVPQAGFFDRIRGRA